VRSAWAGAAAAGFPAGGVGGMMVRLMVQVAARAGEFPGLAGEERGVVLVGRAAESAWLRRRLAQARTGQGCVVLLAGDPGVGKTTLVQRVCASAGGFRVLRATGVESEASLAFSVLADICRPLLGLLEQVPGPQAAALQGALALGPAVPADRFAVFAGGAEPAGRGRRDPAAAGVGG
jgi:AAA ATPase-like protein